MLANHYPHVSARLSEVAEWSILLIFFLVFPGARDRRITVLFEFCKLNGCANYEVFNRFWNKYQPTSDVALRDNLERLHQLNL